MSHVDALLAAAGLKPILSTGHHVRTRVLRVGPKEAAAFLAANKDNRKPRPGRARFYARTMAENGWRLTHQGIAFCIDGRGLDLQHRMMAVLLSGVTIDIMVTEGLSPEAFDAIDQHERRTMSDALRVDRSLADVARMLIRARGGSFAGHPTVLEVGEVVGIIEESHAQLIAACNSRRAVFTSAPVRAAAVVLMAEQHQNAGRICDTYKMLANSRTEQFPPVLHAFNRQFVQGVTFGSDLVRLDLMARALVALDPKRAQQSKIQLKAAAIEYLRDRVISLIGQAEDDADKQVTKRARATRLGIAALPELY